MSTTDDATNQLDLRFASGHEGALRSAYDEHGGLVFGLCRRTLRPEQAEEVTQDVFVSAWRARHQFDPSKGTLAAWLVGITKRRIIDHVRSERRHSDRRADPPDDTTDNPTAHDEHDVDRLANRMLVADALRNLAPRPREVIELAYIHDLTHHEIVERTGIPLGTVKSDIRRGLARIRDHLESAHA